MKKTKKRMIIFMIIFCLSLGVIGNMPIIKHSVTVQAATVKISKKNATMYVGKTLQLKISGTKSKVIWKTSNKNIATVSNKGVVKAKKAGKVTIKAIVNKKTYKANVTVKNIPKAKISLSSKSLSLYIGDTVKISASTENYNGSITWSSSNPSVAIVNNGTITAMSKGTTIITATAGTAKASCVVTVQGNKQSATTDPVQDTTETNSSVTEENKETIKARELGLIPKDWEDNLLTGADFAGFNQLITGLITLCDKNALSVWQANVDSSAFPQRTMIRDDGLVLLMLAAETLNYNIYNARDYGFCTENYVDYDLMFSQLSWDYPYCNAKREIAMYFQDGGEDPIGNVPISAIFWMQRRMDVNQRVHFLDCDEKLNFHLDERLTREDAIAAVVRLYNSETLEYDPLAFGMREPNEEDKSILSAAEVMNQAILTNTDELTCERTAYYVSNSGNDANNGLTPETAWATINKVNTANLSRGDGVYFERGGTWRGQLWAQEGVIYSAYGEGAKPNIFASPENGADPNKWSLLEGTDNIWVYHMDMMDCGILVFNDGESWGTKVAPHYMDGYQSTRHKGQPFDVKIELTEDLMFFSEADSILYDGAPFRYTVMDTGDRGEYSEEVVGTLYLRCDAGNPGEVFDSIEFAVRQNIVLPADDTVFHNLCLKYTGAHCIYGFEIGYDVSFCEIGWIGGSPQYYRYDNGEPVIMGNGVECDGNYDHYSVTDCYIYQCYDAGVSNQDPAESSEVTGSTNYENRDVIQRNITYARNIFAYNDMPIEIFFTLEDNAGYGRHCMENVLIEENCFLYTGYGWYMGTKGAAGSAYQGHNSPNASENFRIINNVFYLSTGPLLQTGAPEKWQPELDGNTYVQNDGGLLISWFNEEEGYMKNYSYYYNEHQDTVTDVIRDVLGDKNGVALKN